MKMTNDDINVLQILMQLYDKGLVSKKTVLGAIDINAEEEQKEIEKDIEFDKKRYQTQTDSCPPAGGCGSGPA